MSLFIALCKMRQDNNDLIVVQVSDDVAIDWWRTKEDAMAYYEAGYRQTMERGGAWGSSAVMNWLTYQYSIIEVSDLADIQARVLSEKPKLLRCRNIAGYLRGISTRPEAAALWEAGDKPWLAVSKDL